METDSFSIVSGTSEGSSPILFTALSQNFSKNDHTKKVKILQRDSVSPIIPELANDVSSKVKKTVSDVTDTVTCPELWEETIINKDVTKLTEKKKKILNSDTNDLDENQIQVHVNQVANINYHAISNCETIPEGLSDKPGPLCTQFEGSQDLFASQNISDERSNNTPTKLQAASTTCLQNCTTKISPVPSPAKRFVTRSSSPSSCQLSVNIDFIKSSNSLQGTIDALNNAHEDDRYSIMTCSTVPPAPSRQLSPKYVGSGSPQGFSKQENVSKTNSSSSGTVNTRAAENFLQDPQIHVELNSSRHEEISQIKKSINCQDKSAFMVSDIGPWLQGQSRMQESIVVNALEPMVKFPSSSQSKCSEIFNLTDDICILNNGRKSQKPLEANINTAECRNIGNDLRVTTSDTFDQGIQISSTVNFGENFNSSGEKKTSTPSSQNAVSSQILDASSSHQLSHKVSDGKNSQKNQSKTIAHDRELESLARLVTLYDKLLEKMERKNVVIGIIPQLDKFQTIIDKFIKSQEEERRRLFPRKGKEKRSRSQLIEHELRVKQLGERQALLQVALSKNKLLTERLRPCQADHHRRRAIPENVSQQPENVSLLPVNVSLQPENVSLQLENVSQQPDIVSQQPENVPLQPENVPLHSVNVPLHSVNVPLHSVNVPLHSVNVPLHSVNVPLHSVNVPQQPENVSQQPENVSQHPVNVLLHPVNVSQQPENVSQHPVNVLLHPVNVSQQPENVSQHPVNVLLHPVNVSQQPKNVSQQPENVSQHPVNILLHPVNVSQQPENVSQQPENVSQQPENVSQHPVNVLLQPENVSKKSESVSLLYDNRSIKNENISLPLKRGSDLQRNKMALFSREARLTVTEVLAPSTMTALPKYDASIKFQSPNLLLEDKALCSRTNEIIPLEVEGDVSGLQSCSNDTDNHKGVTHGNRSLLKRKSAFHHGCIPERNFDLSDSENVHTSKSSWEREMVTSQHAVLPHEVKDYLEPSTQGTASPGSVVWLSKKLVTKATRSAHCDGGKKKRLVEVVPLELKVNAIQGRRNGNGAEQRKGVIPDKPTGPQHMKGANIGQPTGSQHVLGSKIGQPTGSQHMACAKIGYGVLGPCQDDPVYFSSTSVIQVEQDLQSKEDRFKANGPLSPQVRFDYSGTFHSHVASVELGAVGSSCPTTHLMLGEISSVTKPNGYGGATDVTVESSQLTTCDSDTLHCLPGKINMFIKAVRSPEHEEMNELTETIQKARCDLTKDVSSEANDHLLSGYRSDVFTTETSGKGQGPSIHHRPSSPCSTVSSCLFPVSSKEIVRRIESRYAVRQQGMSAPSIQQTRPTGSHVAHGSECYCKQVPKCVTVSKGRSASKQELGTSDQTRAHVIAKQCTMSSDQTRAHVIAKQCTMSSDQTRAHVITKQCTMSSDQTRAHVITKQCTMSSDQTRAHVITKQCTMSSDQTRAHVITKQCTMSVPTNNMTNQQTEHSMSIFHQDRNITTEKSTLTQTACSPDVTQAFHTVEPNLHKRKQSLTNPCRKRGRPRKPQASTTIQCDMGNNSKQREIRKYFPITLSPSCEEGNQIDGWKSELLKRQNVTSGPDIIFQPSTMDGNNCTAMHHKEKSAKQEFSCVREEQVMDPVLLLKGIRTIQLIEDDEVTGTTGDIPGDFWLKNFAEVRMSESFWNTVDSW